MKNEFKYRFSLLGNDNPHFHKSYIRKTKPDYLLEIMEDDLSFNSDEGRLFYLNFGDLYICALNSIENPQKLDFVIAKCFEQQNKCREDLTEYLDSISSSEYGRLIDNKHYLGLNGKYQNAMDDYIFNAALAFFLSEDKYGSGLFSAELTMLLSENSTEYGATTAEQLRENLAEHNVFSDIDVCISYQRDGSEEYTFPNGYSLIGFEMRQFIKQNKEIKVCENCEKFFIPSIRSDEKYCDFIFKGNKTCKQMAFEIKLENDVVLKEYRKIYKTQHARMVRNNKAKNKEGQDQLLERFNNWTEYAIKQRELCRSEKITLDEMVTKISGTDWLNGGTKNAAENNT